MRFVICYDIADNRRREHVADTLLDYGMRVQESVFECLLDANLAAELHARLGRVIAPLEDKLLIAPLCERCSQAVERQGLQPVVEDAEFFIL